MSSPVDSLPSSPTADTYRPLTPLALVGLVFALLSLLVFVFQKGWVLLFFALPGLLIALMARQRVRRSEGTLAGGGIANAALAVCLVSLVGWTTNYAVKYWIIRSESQRFVEEFLDNLRADPEGKRAFLATLPAIGRSLPFNLDQPDAVTKLRRHFSGGEGAGTSLYDGFRRDRIWRELIPYGEQVRYERAGVGDWRYDQSRGTYRVEHRYRVSTPSTEVELIIVASSEIVQEEGSSRRDWRIEGQGQYGTRYANEPVFTEYGRQRSQALSEFHGGLMEWMNYVIAGEKEKAQAMIVAQAPENFDKLYSAVRGNTPTGQRAPGGVKDMILLKEEQKGPLWAFTMLFVGETDQYDMQFRATVQGDPHGKRDTWRIVDPELVMYSKRTPPAGVPGPGMKPGS